MKKLFFLLGALLLLFPYNEIIAQQKKATYIYRNDSIFDAFACAEIDSITYEEENGISNQIIWTNKVVNKIPVSVIDSISFEVPKTIIMQIPEEDLNGWDLGYSLGDEYVVAYFDEADSTLVTMINKNGGKEDAGLILCYDIDGNIVKVGNVDKLYDVKNVEDNIVLSRLNDDGFFEEEIIPILYNNPSFVKQSSSITSFSYFWYCFEGGVKFIDDIKDAQSIIKDIMNWDWVQLAKDSGSAALDLGVFIGKENPLTGTIFSVAKWYVELCIRQLNERDRKVMYRDCEIEIDEIRPENGNCVVYTKVKNADSLFDYLVNMYDRTENEKTRNLVSCGIVVRENNDYVTTHLYDFKSKETQLNGDIDYGSEAYLSFTIPGVNLTKNHSTFYFRPYLTSTRIKTRRGDVDEGHIKYGETVSYRAFNGEIIEFKQYDSQYSTDAYNQGFVMFRTTVHAKISSLDNIEEWGVYVYNLNGNGEYDLYPSEYKAAKQEDWIDVDFNINKNEFDEINNEYFFASKNIKLGLYKKINNPTGTFDYLSLFYSEPLLYELVYNKKPSAITLEMVSTEMTSAVVECQYEGCAIWDVECGIEYSSNDSYGALEVIPRDDKEQRIRLTGLSPSTTYTYQAYYKSNGNMEYGTKKTFMTMGIPVKITDVKLTDAHYDKDAGFTNYNHFKYDVAVTVELINQEGVEDWGYVYEESGYWGKERTHISLKDFDSPYTDKRYSYYSTAPTHTIRLYEYVKYENSEMLEDDERIEYGKPVDYKLEYALPCPDDNHPHAIDLGLPSGTKWACCNVGASKPEDSGGYYAWGEIKEKDYQFGREYTYLYKDVNGNTQYQYIGDDIAGTEYDVAHVKWGGSWKMPSYEQIKELGENSFWFLVGMGSNDIGGQVVVGQDRRSIFLPLTGSFYYTEPGEGLGTRGYYWSSTLYPKDVQYSPKMCHAYDLYFEEHGWQGEHHNHDPRFVGESVRPICP